MIYCQPVLSVRCGFLKTLITKSLFRNGARGYKFHVLGYKNSFFVMNHTDSLRKYNEVDFIQMLESNKTLFDTHALN